jgi:hypothetical protein
VTPRLCAAAGAGGDHAGMASSMGAGAAPAAAVVRLRLMELGPAQRLGALRVLQRARERPAGLGASSSTAIDSLMSLLLDETPPPPELETELAYLFAGSASEAAPVEQQSDDDDDDAGSASAAASRTVDRTDSWVVLDSGFSGGGSPSPVAVAASAGEVAAVQLLGDPAAVLDSFFESWTMVEPSEHASGAAAIPTASSAADTGAVAATAELLELIGDADHSSGHGHGLGGAAARRRPQKVAAVDGEGDAGVLSVRELKERLTQVGAILSTLASSRTQQQQQQPWLVARWPAGGRGGWLAGWLAGRLSAGCMPGDGGGWPCAAGDLVPRLHREVRVGASAPPPQHDGWRRRRRRRRRRLDDGAGTDDEPPRWNTRHILVPGTGTGTRRRRRRRRRRQHCSLGSFCCVWVVLIKQRQSAV